MKAVLCIAILLTSACAPKPAETPAVSKLEVISDHFKIKLEYPALKSDVSEPARSRINAAIARNALRHLQDADDTPKSFDDFVKEIAAENEEMRKEPGGAAPWANECICTEAHRTQDNVVVKCNAYSSTGAAYPNRSTNYETYSLKDGRTLTLADFVDPARHEALRKLVEADFRKQRGPEVEFEKLPLDDHFAPLQEGLVFHYSPGDVGPHALGETTVVIPYASLK